MRFCFLLFHKHKYIQQTIGVNKLEQTQFFLSLRHYGVFLQADIHIAGRDPGVHTKVLLLKFHSQKFAENAAVIYKKR
jgi:hypothetical protein